MDRCARVDQIPPAGSAPITLEAGKRYYIEALMKEGIGGDNLAVGWIPPGAQTITVIPGQYLSAFDPVVAPLAAWRFDEGSWNGTAGGVRELAGNVSGIHGTAAGGAATSAAAPALAGNPGTGRAGVFNGSSQYVSVPFNAALNPDDFTLSAWVNPATATSPALRAVAVSRQTVGGAIRGFGLYASADGKWSFFTGATWSALVGPAVVANEWAHLTATFRTTAITNGVRTGIRRIFVNGILAAEDNGNYIPVTSSPLLIGASELTGGTGYFMNGSIDEVRFHAEPLALDDVIGVKELRHRLNSSPAVTSPGALVNSLDSIVSQAIQASDPNGDPLVFSATGLPGGLSISPGSGIISGSPDTVGAFNVTVTATDPSGDSGSAAFVWTIVEKLSVTPVSAPPSPAGNTVTLNATASGGVNPRYQWNFGDGSPDTAFSASTSTTHNFPGPGRYLVTVTATDDSGSTVTRSFHQAIHAPLTATKPTASSPICHEDRPAGNDRVWVVNPDNDSVTVIDAVTRARLAEIPTGTSPRCIAVAPDGSVWVTNATSASVSIISPDTLAVLQTLPLPRGSVLSAWHFPRMAPPLLSPSKTPASFSNSIRFPEHCSPARTSGQTSAIYPFPLTVRRFTSAASSRPGFPVRKPPRSPRRTRRRGGCRRSRDLRNPADAAASTQRAGRQRYLRPRHPELPRSSCHLAGRTQRVGPLQAGQRQTRQTPRQPGPHPRHERPQHRLAPQPDTPVRGPSVAGRFRQRRRPQRRRLRPVGDLRLRRPGSQPRGGGRRCLEPPGNPPLRCRTRAAGPHGLAGWKHAVCPQFHGPQRQHPRHHRADRRHHQPAARAGSRCVRHHRKTPAADPARKATLLRREGQPPRAPGIPFLRRLPQRRRAGRPGLGLHRLRRRTPQHDHAARPRRNPQGPLHWSGNFDEVQDFENQIRNFAGGTRAHFRTRRTRR